MTALRYRPSEKGFMALPAHDAGPAEAARAVIIPFGLEATVCSGKGTANGPEVIIAASLQLDQFDEYFWCEPFRQYGIATHEPVTPAADHAAALDQIAALTAAALDAGKFPLVLGGEHSLTIGAIRPFLDRYRDLAVLQVDAHADLWSAYNGSPISHASAMRRIVEGRDTPLVSVGIRCISAEEIACLEANRQQIHMHFAIHKARWRLEDIVAPLKGRPVYVTFDVDGFDAGIMPATGTPEPGGLGFTEACELLKAVAEVSTIVGGDLVELAPIPGFHAYDHTAAKLAYRMMSFAHVKPV